MIQASELRIGNWCFSGMTKTNFKCDAFDILNIATGKDEGLTVPIPLTPELLIKCGFELQYGGQLPDYIESNGFMMYWYDDKLSANFGHVKQLDVEIKFLHQLQNLYFALTQQELPIDSKQM